MDYRQMLEGQESGRIMLIEDNTSVTYGEFLGLVEEQKRFIPQQGEGVLCPICRDTVMGELVEFIACQGMGKVPVIVAEDMSEKERRELAHMEVPKGAVMGAVTSGTTGKHKVLFRTYESWADCFPVQNRLFSMDGNTVLFAQGSLAFTGNLNLYLALFFAGGTVVTTKRFEPRRWFSLIREHRVNYLYLIPAKMAALCRAVKFPVASVRHFVTGSQSFGRRERVRVKECFPSMEVMLYYGCSEAGYITYLTGKEMTEDSRLVGRAFPGVKVDIQNGLFFADSPYGVMEITHPFCTGDLGSVDDKGYFYYEGRRDDRLNVNGKKCSAYRIEQVIREQLGISEVLVTVERAKDRDWLAAYYERQEGGNLSSWRKRLREKLPETEVPRRLIPVEQLPRTAGGKIRRDGRNRSW